MDRTHDAAPPLLTIGDLAERTGLPVRTIRYWSEVGVVPEATRSAGGHRLYDAAGLARLELVATLRELGLGHAEVRRVLARESTVAEVAAAHVAAIDAQLSTLRLRRAVLSAIATGEREDPARMDRLNRMAQLSAQERQQIIDEFVAQVSEGLDADPQVRDRLRGGGHRLPDAPTQQQLDAWLELSELMLDPGFRQVVRRALTQSRPVQEGRPDPSRVFADKLDRTVGVALREGTPPDAPAAAAIVDRLLDNPDARTRASARSRLRARLDAGIDGRLENYRRLLAVLQDQQPPTPRAAAFAWLAAALDAEAASTPGTDG